MKTNPRCLFFLTTPPSSPLPPSSSVSQKPPPSQKSCHVTCPSVGKLSAQEHRFSAAHFGKLEQQIYASLGYRRRKKTHVWSVHALARYANTHAPGSERIQPPSRNLHRRSVLGDSASISPEPPPNPQLLPRRSGAISAPLPQAIMAPSFDQLREADLDDDEFNEDEIDISDLREKFEVQLEQGYDTFVVIDGLPEVTEDQKPKLVKFLLKKLNTVGKTKEELIYMPMGEDGKSQR